MKIGIMGTNFIGDRLLEAAATLPPGTVTAAAVYSRREETGRAFAAKHGIPGVYTDMDAFFRSGIDAVYVATPNFCHAGQSIAALRAGLHVLCEKPLCQTLAEAEEAFRAADEHGCVLMEAMRPCHDPAWDAIRDALSAIAPLRQVRLEYCQYSSRYDRFKAGDVQNAFRPDLGNAAVMDIGSYPVEVLAMLFGLPDELFCRSIFLSNGFEGAGNVIAAYPGMTAEIVYSKIADSATPSVFLGEGGSVTVDKLSTPSRAVLRLRDGTETVLPTREGENNMDYELLDFVAACSGTLRGAERFRRYSLDAMRMLDEIRAQAGK